MIKSLPSKTSGREREGLYKSWINESELKNKKGMGWEKDLTGSTQRNGPFIEEERSDT